jgi:2-methylisocitrate lyase-like PEP mutase family enzyme
MAGNLKAAELRRLLAKGEFILAPGIYDGISARVADGMGFPALYMTGYGATASMLGLPTPASRPTPTWWAAPR